MMPFSSLNPCLRNVTTDADLAQMVCSISTSFGDLHVRHNTNATPGSILWLADHLAHIIEGTADKYTDLEGKGNVRR
jgi:hypothetical protein